MASNPVVNPTIGGVKVQILIPVLGKVPQAFGTRGILIDCTKACMYLYNKELEIGLDFVPNHENSARSSKLENCILNERFQDMPITNLMSIYVTILNKHGAS